MEQKYVSGDKSRSVESLRHLRLMALLKELEKDEGRMEAAAMLGVNYKTLAKAIDTGELSRRMSHALERLLLSGGEPAVIRQGERIEALEERTGTLVEEMRSGQAATAQEAKALREELAQTLRRLERRVGNLEAAQGAQAEKPVSGNGKPSPAAVRRRLYPELVTVEPADDDEAVFGAAWPLIEEWRRLTADPSQRKGLSRVLERERILALEVAMLKEHGLTLPPETQPLTGIWRRDQLAWRQVALYEAQRSRAKRELLRWVRRILTLRLWWK